jgi:hypothetical protein
MKSYLADTLLLVACVLAAALVLQWNGEAKAALPAAPASVTVKYVRADHHQREMIARVLSVCDRLGGSRKVLIASIATITQESGATNLAGGHGTSVGLFQIIDIHVHGVDRRRNPEWAAWWFCSRAINVDYHRRGLTVAQLSQAVQRSAYPSAYGLWTREAVRTYRLTMRRR